MPYRPDFDPYLYEGSEVLRNLAGIRGPVDLEHFETAVTLFRQMQVEARPILGKFDLDHLRAIHRHLFQDVFDWAGEIRTVDISKGGTRFGAHQFIESYAKSILGTLALERADWGRDLPLSHLVGRLAFYLSEINAMHPFREGNGRTQRIFISQLAATFRLSIRWDRMTPEEMLHASIESFSGNLRPMQDLIGAHIEKIP